MFDMAFSFCAILLLSPLLLTAALLVLSSGPGPIFFRHKRVGSGFVPFSVLKFRTMSVGADTRGPQVTVGGDNRITAIGRFLRKSKLDELPQLFNVLIGQMSVVGPRPEAPAYVEKFMVDYQVVLGVLPGITDYAAIEYRNEEELLSRYDSPEAAYLAVILPAKIKLYRKYLADISFRTDLKIIFSTVFTVFKF